jgi:hypothetical protein
MHAKLAYWLAEADIGGETMPGTKTMPEITTHRHMLDGS